MVELQLSDPNGNITVFIFTIPKKNEKKNNVLAIFAQFVLLFILSDSHLCRVNTISNDKKNMKNIYYCLCFVWLIKYGDALEIKHGVLRDLTKLTKVIKYSTFF